MNIIHHQNPITQHNRNVRAQLPQGVIRQTSKGSNLPVRCLSSGVCHKYVGIDLVKWYLTNDMKPAARELLVEIKAGIVNPRTGERNDPSRK